MKQAEMEAELIDLLGSDLTVVNAARVSFAKESSWEFGSFSDYTNDPDNWSFNGSKPEPGFEQKYTGNFRKLKDGDAKLLKYLATHNHWSPFGHAQAQFRIKAPIFVARQLVKHQIGLVWNEESRRYIDSEPEFWFPRDWRSRPENKKQGSGDKFITIMPHRDSDEYIVGIDKEVKDCVQSNVNLYNRLLDAEVAPEQARMVLPQNMLVSWYWTGSLMAFARVCNLRLPSDAQAETTEVAKLISFQMEESFPKSWEFLVKRYVDSKPLVDKILGLIDKYGSERIDVEMRTLVDNLENG